MKPLHLAMIVVGAALAGGLAVRMTQPLPMQATVPAKAAAPAPAPVAAPSVHTSAVQQPIAAVTAPPPVVPAVAPPPVWKEEVKPKPKPFVAAKAEAPKPVAAPKPLAAAKAAERVKPELAKPEPTKPEPAKAEPAKVEKVEVAKVETPPPAPYQPPAIEEKIIPAPAPPPAPPPPPRQVVLSAGTPIPVRLNQTLSTEHLVAGDTFQASLAEPLVVDGLIVAERGARASGRVVDSRRGVLQLALSMIQTADGQKVSISTEPWAKQADRPRNEDIAKVGGGAALGAIIGAIAGGGKGAAIGAGVGGGAGVGAAAMTRSKGVNLPTETVIRFRLGSRVTITERQL